MNEVTKTSQAKSSQFRNLIIFSVFVMVIFAIFIWILSQQTKSNEKIIEKTKFSNPLEHADSETIVLERVQKSVQEAKVQTENLKKQFDAKMMSSSDDTKQKELEERLKTLEAKLSNSQNNENNAPTNPSLLSGSQQYQGRVLPRAASYEDNQNGNNEVDMREDKLSLSPTDEALARNRPIKNIDTYVPAGTFAKAIVIGGANVSAAVSAQTDPSVMLFRVVASGTLPNHKKSHLKDCVFTAAAVGDISSERGRIRTERLSCVFPNGQVFDEAVEGTVFGPDGKNDLPGNVHEGDGKFVGRAFAAGALSGLSDGLSQTYTTNSISPEGNVQTVNSGKIFQYGAAKGASKAMDKVADYNIKRAEQFHPVIQLSAGTIVDVVFLKGFFLDGKKHDGNEKESNNTPNLFGTTTQPTSASFLSPDERTLPLSAEQIKMLQERSKELGLRVSEGTPS